MSSTSDITGLLIGWCDGDKAAIEVLAQIVEKELRRLAHHYLQQERPGHTLQTAAVINEAYLRLINRKRVVSQT